MSFDFTKHTGIDYGFSFRTLTEVPETDVATYCSKLRQQYAALTKGWTGELNTQWFCRNYLAVKMILAATVMLTSESYAERKNLKIVGPYLLYYATLCCCRAVVFGVPEQRWSDELYEMSHSKILNIAIDSVRHFSKSLGEEADRVCREAQATRELFSYQFPAEGTSVGRSTRPADWDSVLRVCRILAELAQLRSECLESAVSRHATGEYPVDSAILERCYIYETDAERFIDDDDVYRINHWMRRSKRPYNLCQIATEGLVDDFFGAWVPVDTAEEDAYNPDEDKRLIFPFN